MPRSHTPVARARWPSTDRAPMTAPVAVPAPGPHPALEGQGPTRSIAAPRRPALPALTSVRFLAALHVVVYHFFLVFPSRLPWLVAGVIGAGYTGVSFFFVLSGFVLAYNYLDDR